MDWHLLHGSRPSHFTLRAAQLIQAWVVRGFVRRDPLEVSCVAICRHNVSLREKARLHLSHRKGLLPLCLLTCLTRCSSLLNFNPHSLHSLSILYPKTALRSFTDSAIAERYDDGIGWHRSSTIMCYKC